MKDIVKVKTEKSDKAVKMYTKEKIDKLFKENESSFYEDIYLDDFLSKNNTASYTPTTDYHPSTKKYVDDSVSNAGGGDMLKTVYDRDNDGKVNSAERADYVDWYGVNNKPSAYPPESHNHDSFYEPKDNNIQTHIASMHAPNDAQKNSDITKLEIEAKLTGNIISHSHDERYYTESEIDIQMSGKSSTDHTHDYASIGHSHHGMYEPALPDKTSNANKILVVKSDESGVEWIEQPSDNVGSVNGKTGAVVLTTDDIVDSENKRYVKDSEKTIWNNKSNFSGSYNDLTNKPTIPITLESLIDDAAHRTVSDNEITTWNNKGDMLKSVYDSDNDGKVDSAKSADTVDWYGINNKPSTFSPSSHNHDSLYEPQNTNIQSHISSTHAPNDAQKNSDITKAEIETKLTGNIISHTHDERYYTESEIDTQMSGKSDAEHTHNYASISHNHDGTYEPILPSKISNANKMLAVKSDENGAEWVDAPSGGELLKHESAYALDNGSARPTLGDEAVDLSYTDGTTGATGDYSFVEGYETIASGESSHAEGENSKAMGRSSHAQNNRTIAKGKSQTAIGEYNIEQGTEDSKVGVDHAFIIGNGLDEDNRSNALTVNWNGDLKSYGNIEDGSGNILSKNLLIPFGVGYSFDNDSTRPELGHKAIDLSYSEEDAFGAKGQYSLAEGFKTTTTKQCSHAEGYKTKALGNDCHAEGSQTEAWGYQAHAGGYKTKAYGDQSHSFGNRTIAQGKYQTVVGRYNLPDGDSETLKHDAPIFTVGIGDSENNRKNAFAIDGLGTVKINGSLDILQGIHGYRIISDSEYEENFESDFGSWINEGVKDWIRKSGSTPSPDTGASEAFEGDYYVYVETSDGYSFNDGDENILSYDMGSSKSGSIEFYYHRYGSDQGKFYVEGFDGAGWLKLFSLENTSAKSNYWQRAEVTFDFISKLRFRNIAAGGYRSDVCLDKIKVKIYSISDKFRLGMNGTIEAFGDIKDGGGNVLANKADINHDHNETYEPILPDKTSNANKILAVNSDASALEWIDPPSGGGGTGGKLLLSGVGYSLDNGQSRPTLGEDAIDLSKIYIEDDPNTGAIGKCSFACGYGTKASGESSFAEGQGGKAAGRYAHAEGSYTRASGEGGHAEGASSSAIGDWSHAEGCYASAKGMYSHSQNFYTIAKGHSQTAIGRYNIEQGTEDSRVDADYAFIIGNGEDNYNRSNALTVNWQGDIKASGEIEDGNGNKLGEISDKINNYGKVGSAPTSNYTLVLSDANTFVKPSSSSDIIITIPADSSVDFPIGTEIVLAKWNTGAVSFSPASGVSLFSKDNKRSIDGQHATVTLKKMASNEWLLVGSLV